MKTTRIQNLLTAAFACALAFAATIARAADPLPSWNDTAPKKAIIVFVEKVTTAGSPDFVPAPERIAVVDNDGTLWAEQPMCFQFLFVLDRVKAGPATSRVENEITRLNEVAAPKRSN